MYVECTLKCTVHLTKRTQLTTVISDVAAIEHDNTSNEDRQHSQQRYKQTSDKTRVPARKHVLTLSSKLSYNFTTNLISVPHKYSNL